MENKEIRFIDSKYKELFKIPDGGSIKVTLDNGEEIINKCKYIDEYHVDIDGRTFHIAEYAEIMERIGNKYEPVEKEQYTIEGITEEETQFLYSDDNANRGDIGHIRADFGSNGNGFYPQWFGGINNLNTAEFREELNNIMNKLRLTGEKPILKDRNSMREFCYKEKPYKIEDAWTNTYGFKITTDKHTHYFRCTPAEGEYNLYVYSFDNKQLQIYEDISFAEKYPAELIKDKFFRTDTGITEVYYNPNADAGGWSQTQFAARPCNRGQLVYIEISDSVIQNAAKQSKTPTEFFSYIESAGRGYLIDAGTPEFRGNIESFIERKADFEDCTKKTMNELTKTVGIEPTKNHKNKDVER